MFESIKNFFLKKANNQETGAAPEGICPNCWGHEEWEGEYYKVIKDPHNKPGSEIYNNFIKKVADRFDNTSHKHETTYECQTCKLKY